MQVAACGTDGATPVVDSTDRLSSDSTEFRDPVEMRRRPETGAVQLVRGADLSADLEQSGDYRQAAEKGDYGRMAVLFVDRHRPALSISSSNIEFVVRKVTADQLGFHSVRLGQTVSGLPVVNAEVIVQFDADGDIDLLTGHYATDARNVVLPFAVDEVRASEVLRSAYGADASISAPRPCVYLSRDGAATAAYEFDVSTSIVDTNRIYLDAQSGSVLATAKTVFEND